MDRYDEDDNTLVNTLLIVIIVILCIIVLTILVLFCCFREWMERLCVCLSTVKVTPEGSSQWHHVDRFGETRLKYVTYKMGNNSDFDKESLAPSEETVNTNISLQVPLFEEYIGRRSQS